VGTAAELARITHAKIHPAIGIARVGNSPAGYFFAPETLHPGPLEAPECYRDTEGNLARQAVRFRVYGYGRGPDGREFVVSELTKATASIRWTVHVANAKAAWYASATGRPADIPEAGADQFTLRNPGVDRSRLVIDPGPRTVSGDDPPNLAVPLEGRLCRTPACLGEIRADSEGRLVFLGGRGAILEASATVPGVGEVAVPGDDISDGPVDAEVRIKGGDFVPCQGAWVLTAPPAYAPQIRAVRTLYDLLQDVAIAHGRMAAPDPGRIVSFADDILPIFQRLSDLQWLSGIYLQEFGLGAPRWELMAPALLSKLRAVPPAAGEDPHAVLRRLACDSFRTLRATTPDQAQWPPQLGDDAAPWPSVPDSPRAYLSLAEHQLASLQCWADGKFHDDPGSPALVAPRFDAVDPAHQPALLDRASLSGCAADAFHPGIDVTWIIRQNAIFDPGEAFRVRRPAGPADPGPWPVSLAPATILAPGSRWLPPGPGGITRWMAVPWQKDFVECLGKPGYPAFWPARVPDAVLRRDQYEAVVKKRGISPEARRRGLRERGPWFFSNPYDMTTGAGFAALPLILKAEPKQGEVGEITPYVAG
jgi:hypothetical protein